MASEYLAAWRSGYPGLPHDNALLFVDSQGKGMQYRAIAFQITRAAKRAGIEKRCNPHVFRKSRLTEMVREGYQESVIKKIGWNNEGTAMIKTYIRLGSDDVLREFMIKSGIKPNEEKQRNNLPRQCSYCFAMNSAISEYCHKCGQPLTDEARDKLKSATEAIEESLFYKQIREMVKKEVEKMNSNLSTRKDRPSL